MPAAVTRWLNMSVVAAAHMLIVAKSVNGSIGFPGVIGLGVNGLLLLQQQQVQQSSTVRHGAGTGDR